MRIAILGATGMLGSQMFKSCLEKGIDVHAVVRNKRPIIDKVGKYVEQNLHVIDDIKDIYKLKELLSSIKPDYVINCIGIVKQSHLSQEYVEAIGINSLFPHQLQELGQKIEFKLINISTDCVFDGKIGGYKESDLPNATDLYGRTKFLGEVGYGCGITIRTSIIGHELFSSTQYGLVEWFLAQLDSVKGFKKAIFSGLTTLELSKVILEIVIPSNLRAGLYHISSQPISKYDLLAIIAEVYNKRIEILPSDELLINRTLDGSKFREITNYITPNWFDQISDMKINFNKDL